MSLPQNKFAELGRTCPHRKSGEKFLGALVTDFPLQARSLLYYPVPFSPPDPATRFTAPASIYNSSPSTTTVHATTDCLAYRSTGPP